jgi:hypothetical protein
MVDTLPLMGIKATLMADTMKAVIRMSTTEISTTTKEVRTEAIAETQRRIRKLSATSL